MEPDTKDGLIAQFQSASGIEDIHLVIEYLEKANWDMEVALTNVLGDEPVVVKEIRPAAAAKGLSMRRNMTTYGSYYHPGASTSRDDNGEFLYTESGVSPCSRRLNDFSGQAAPNLGIGSGVSDVRPFQMEGNRVNYHQSWNNPGSFPDGSDTGTFPDADARGSSSDGSDSRGCRKRRISSTDIQPGPNSFPAQPLISVRKDVLAPPRPPPSPPKSPHIIETIDLLDSDDDFEDANTETFAEEDDIFIDGDSIDNDDNSRPGTLIPENIQDEQEGAALFVDAFKGRYGANCPNFFPGPLETAISLACLRPAKDRKLLAIYIHHDASVLTNVFCTELLCCESILDTLSHNFLVWGWDITNESNKEMLISSLHRTLSPHVANTIRDYSIDNFPTLMIVTRNRGNTELLETINGNIGVNELLSALIHAVDIFTDMQAVEVKEEDERAERERIVTQQDLAYEESLQMDRAKEEARRMQEQQRNEESERIKREKEEEEERRKVEIEAVIKTLPPEPSDGASGSSFNIRFRCPSGSTLNRRFNCYDTLGVLFDYLLVSGYRVSEFKLIALCPRRDFSEMERKMTLQELGIHPQETLILEER